MVAATGGIAGFAIADEFLEHANQEQAHADRLAERIVSDPTTRRLLEGVLEQEEEHADELADFLKRIPR